MLLRRRGQEGVPAASTADISTVPLELFARFQMSFYQSPEGAVFKALGVE
ncbi:MAG: hypothetical protein PHF87_08595 [Desulfotomaculaceae bacterium]|nr:hypothetical protein [Desulfotomaculaceae bacterium]